jgi:hypothetical protein
MSVILCKSDDVYEALGKPCSACGKSVKYPFVCWERIIVCGACCGQIRRGLAADLLQVAAVAELQTLYPRATLVRAEGKPDKARLARVFPQLVDA